VCVEIDGVLGHRSEFMLGAAGTQRYDLKG
jgi:hypothetical protein